MALSESFLSSVVRWRPMCAISQRLGLLCSAFTPFLLWLLPLRQLIVLAIVLHSLGLSHGWGQTPPWYFINTGIANSHIILFLDTVPITINGVQIEEGDYVGAFFYDEFGNLKCGTGTGNTGDIGGMRWEGQTAAAATWGTEPNVYNGFQTGEEMKWRVWRASDGSQFDAIVTYIFNPNMFPDSGLYLPNGISAIATFEAFSIPGKDLSVNKMISPVSGCGLPDSSQVSIIIQNHDSVAATGFYLSISVNQGDTVHYLYTDILQPNSVDTFDFPQYYDFSQVGLYSFYLKVTASGDVNSTNDLKEPIIENRSFPVVSIGNDTAFCDGGWARFFAQPVYPGMLWGDGSADSTLVVSSNGPVYITVTDDLGCQGRDSAFVTLWPTPQFSLGPDTSFCLGRYILMDFGLDYVQYDWSNGTSNSTLYTSIPGTFILSVTDTNGCIGKDTLFVSETSIPIVNLGPNHTSLSPDTLLDAGPGFDAYLWQDGTTTQTYAVTEFGLYSVTVSLAGCTGIDDIRIIQKLVVDPLSDILIFPNPVRGSQLLQFQFPNEDSAILEILDEIGRLVYKITIEKSEKFILDPFDLNSGVYTVSIRSSTFNSSRKFVKI